MKYSKILFIVITCLMLFGAALSYDTGGTASPGTQCTNDQDDDNDGEVDEEDSGCVPPYYEDDSEFDIWDTDMTIEVNSGNTDISEDYTVFFDGKVHRGQRTDTDRREQAENVLNETHVDGVYSENEWTDTDNFGGGKLDWTEYSLNDNGDFPKGTIYPSASNPGLVIDPPNPYGTPQGPGGEVVGEAVNCGDGYENGGEQLLPKTGDDTEQANSTVDCRADLGRVQVKYHIENRVESDHQDSWETSNNEYKCRSDGMDDSGVQHKDDIECESATDGQCGGGGGSSCSDDTCDPGEDAKCDDFSDIDGKKHSDDGGTSYWYEDGEYLREDTCSTTGSWSVSEQGGSDDSCTDYSCEPNSSVCNSCSSSSAPDCQGGTSDSTDGDYRDWTEDTAKDCNDFNGVNGGGDAGGDESDHYNNEYPNKPDNDPAGTFTDFTAYGDTGWGDSGKVWCGYDSTLTVDADGPQGEGDGWVVVHDGEVIATEGPRGGDTVGQSVYVDGSKSNQDYTGDIETSCSATTCIKYVDFYTESGSWSTEAGAVSNKVVNTGRPDASYSVCKNINRIWRKNYDLDDSKSLVQCDNSGNPGTGGSLTSPSDGGVGGDEENEYWVYMEGPEINKNAFDSNENHYQGIVDNFNDCIVRGKEVSEGTVTNVEPQSSNEQYERGANNVDWEVCLNVDDSVGDPDYEQDWNLGGDEYCMDDQGVINNDAYENNNCDPDHPDYKDAGGEWYDLDSEVAQQYLRGDGNNLITGGDASDPNDIAYYWSENMNPPQHPEHNPEGSRSGTAMEDNCGNSRFDSINCDDFATNDNTKPERGSGQTFFSFFEEGKRDEDYHPQGNSGGDSNLEGFEGFVNRLQDRSNQLESGMETDTYDPNAQAFYENSVGGDDADAWAITKNLRWSVDTTGVPYPPYSTYYRHASDSRGSTDSSSVDKRKKAFANSYAAVATQQFTDQQGVTVNAGDGVWIDPDDMIENAGNVKLTPDANGWKSAMASTDESGSNVGFKIDLTGPDSGLGIDVSDTSDSPECLDYTPDGGCRVSADEVYWEQDTSGNIESELERPVCGDDRLEFFVEEVGESRNSERYDGNYACSDSLNSCYDSSAPAGERLVDQGKYANVDEPNESVGRLKNDKEYCQKIGSQDDFAIWYDQDYRQDFCRENTLYGNDGVRWFDSEYVSEHPQAVKGGIDDSWNKHMEQRNHDSWESDPGNYDDSPQTTPVPTGDTAQKTATLGFCGGDDESEYLATQECNTRYCETDRTIQGVGKLAGSCVFRGEGSRYETNVDERTVFEPGDEITIENVAGDPTIACFNGAWFSDWPVHFNKNQLEVPLGESRTVSFEVINVMNQERTFDVTMEESSDSPSADQFASFVEHSGKEFRTTVGPRSSRTFQVQIRGGNENLDIGDSGSDLFVRAEAINSDLSGSDSVAIGIDDEANTGQKTGTQNVPGIQGLQIIALFVTSVFIFALHGRS